MSLTDNWANGPQMPLDEMDLLSLKSQNQPIEDQGNCIGLVILHVMVCLGLFLGLVL